LLLDRTGRRSIQILGFGMMALMFLIIGFVPVIAKHALPFLLLYGVSYFFTEFGPNTTTFIYPAELFPTEVRTTGHGIAACCSPLPRSPNPRETLEQLEEEAYTPMPAKVRTQPGLAN
jgi:MFS family permease